MNGFVHYKDITRKILDTIKVGDEILVNNWTDPMTVKCVSENYFVMTCVKDEDTYYSVCSKKPWNGIKHNAMVGGMFHCGTDDWICGSPLCISNENLYQFANMELSLKYLQEFEDEKCHVSERNGIAIYDLYVRCSK